MISTLHLPKTLHTFKKHHILNKTNPSDIVLDRYNNIFGYYTEIYYRSDLEERHQCFGRMILNEKENPIIELSLNVSIKDSAFHLAHELAHVVDYNRGIFDNLSSKDIQAFNNGNQDCVHGESFNNYYKELISPLKYL